MPLRYFQTSDGEQHAAWAQSPNSRFTVAWRDSDGVATGGARRNGEGKIWLFDGTREVARVSCQRPNDGSVADNGTFCIADWLFTEKLSSKFLVFSSTGEVLIDKKLSANLNTCAISFNGLFAAAHTCNSLSKKYCNALILFDVATKQEIWTDHPPFWPHQIAFNVERREVVIHQNPAQSQSPLLSCVYTLHAPTSAA